MNNLELSKIEHDLDLIEEGNKPVGNKVIKQDFSKNSLRVVKKFAILPTKISTGGKPTVWIFLEHYYVLQLLSFWGKGWIVRERSLDRHEWDFKWSDAYLQFWADKNKQVNG